MRILLPDLTPGTTYSIQLRAKDDNGNSSPWSKVFTLTTSGDTIAPKTPTNVANTLAGTAFKFTWDAVTLSADNSPAHDLKGYLVRVSSPNSGATRTYVTTDTKMDFSFENNVAVFGIPQAAVRVEVAAYDAIGNTSAYSAFVTATNAAPAAVTNLTATAGVDSINVKWDANITDTDLKGYEVWLSTSGAAGTYSKVYSGLATSYVHPTLLWGTDHYFRVYSVDVFGTQSTAAQSSAIRPNSAFAVDSTAPAVPTGLAGTISTGLVAFNTESNSALNISWNAVTDTDGDLAGYQIGYRALGQSDWQYITADYTVTSTRVDRIIPYLNYDLRIRSFDFYANYSAWSSTVTTSTAASNTAPAAPTGLLGAAGASTVTVLWTENSESDVKFGKGQYEVQMDTANTFNTANLQTIKTSGIVASFRTDGLVAGTRYLRVRAVDQFGLAGAYSSTLAINQVDVGATEAYTQSRGMNLVTNGAGTLGNNKNFSTLTFDASDRPFGGGSFHTGATQVTSRFNDELMPVDVQKTYTLTGYARSRVAGNTTSKLYIGVSGFDVDQNSIQASHHMYVANTLTTLAAPLNPGDTTVTLTSAANWYNSTSTALKGLTFWNYTDSKGYTYPENTYSRNISASTNMWASGGITGNVITLSAPWAGNAYAAGTKVSNGASGGSFKYIAASNVSVPETWTKYTGYIGGVDYSGQNVTTMFPPGTAYVKILLLMNYTGSPAGSNQGVGGFSFSEVAAQNLLPNTMGGDVVIANTLAGDRIIANTADANILKANTSFINDLNVKSTFTMGDATTLGAMRSYEYLNTAGAAGWRLTDNSFVVKTGQIEAAALKIQTSNNMVPAAYADFEYGDGYYISSFWSARGQGNLYCTNGLANSNLPIDSITQPYKGKRYLGITSLGGTGAMDVYFGTSNTDYNINVDPSGVYIFSGYFRSRSTSAQNWNFVVKGDNGAQLTSVPVTFPAGPLTGGYTRFEGTVTIPSSGVSKVLLGLLAPGTTDVKDIHVDALQFEPKGNLTSASVWKPPAVTSIDASGITTGMLRSSNDIMVAGVNQPVWSLNTQGNLQLGDALVRGRLIIGNPGETLPNRAPGSGNFETDVTGYTLYQLTATTPALARTTTAGEVIAGTGSAKVSAAAGAKTGLGIDFALPTAAAGTTITLSFSVKTDSATGSIRAVTMNGTTAVNTAAVLVAAPVAGTVYNVNTTFVVPAGQTVNAMRLYHGGGTINTTSLIFDNINVTLDNEIGNSFVQSVNYVAGSTGWKIDSAGNAEFGSGIFRGVITGSAIYGSVIASTSDVTANRVVLNNTTGLEVWRGTTTNMVENPRLQGSASTSSQPGYSVLNGTMTIISNPQVGYSPNKILKVNPTTPTATTARARYTIAGLVLQPSTSYVLQFRYFFYKAAANANSNYNKYGVAFKRDDVRIIEGTTNRTINMPDSTGWGGSGVSTDDYKYENGWRQAAPLYTEPYAGDDDSGGYQPFSFQFYTPSDWNNQPVTIELPGNGYIRNDTNGTYALDSTARIGVSQIMLEQNLVGSDYFDGSYTGYASWAGTADASRSIRAGELRSLVPVQDNEYFRFADIDNITFSHMDPAQSYSINATDNLTIDAAGPKAGLNLQAYGLSGFIDMSTSHTGISMYEDAAGTDNRIYMRSRNQAFSNYSQMNLSPHQLGMYLGNDADNFGANIYLDRTGYVAGYPSINFYVSNAAGTIQRNTWIDGLGLQTDPIQTTVTMATGWVTYGAPFPTARFYRQADGAWVGTGLIKASVATSVNSTGVTIGTIPNYTCPTQQISGAVASSVANANGWSIQCSTSGVLTFRSNTSTTGVSFPVGQWVSLSGVVFHETAN